MPRRKQIKINAKDLPIYNLLVSELSKDPVLAEYDMESIEINIKKKYYPRIKNIDKAISNIKRSYAANKQFIETFNGVQIISKKELADMLDISRPTLDVWIKNGFITPSTIPGIPYESFFQIEEVIEELSKYE